MKNFLSALLLALCLVSPAAAQDTPAQLAAKFHETRAAAERGDAGAQYDLHIMYATGRGVTQDIEQAIAWLRKAADQGDAMVQTNLGGLYAEGRGVPQDDAEAAKWYRKAAEQGHAPAQYLIGVMSASGRGIAQNKVQAVAWLRKAADQGHTEARELLRMMEISERRGSDDADSGAVPAAPPTSGGLYDRLKKLDEQQQN
jgi:TPR repeat protein